MQIRYSNIFLALAILPLFSGSLVELFPALYLPPLLRVLLFAAGTAILFTKQYTRTAPKSVLRPLALFVLFGFISLAWSYSVDISAQRAALNSVTILFLYIYARKTAPTNQLSVIFWSCLIALFVVGIASIPSYYLNNPTSYYQGNFRGFFSNSNSLGHYISSAAFPLCLYLFFTTDRWKNLIATLALVVLAFLLFETRSRGAFAASFLGGLVIYFGVARFSPPNKSALIFPILASISLIYFAGFAFEKYENAGTLSTRSYLWALHMAAIAERPVLGWGVGVNPVDFKVYVSESYNYLSETEKGTSYYVLPEEIGIPFSVLIFVMFVPFFLKHIPAAFKLMRKYKELQPGLLPVAIVMSGLLHGIFESWFFSFGNPMAIIFWLSCIYIAEFYKDRNHIKQKVKLMRSDSLLSSIRA